MDILFIGTNYSREIYNSDLSEFEQEPYVVLRNRATRMSFSVQSEYGDDNTVCVFTFGCDYTAEMLPGVYDIEIYEDNSMQDMLHYQPDYVRAIKVAADNNESSD